VGTRGLWLDSAHGPVAAWLTEPAGANGLGVLVLPPVGYASSSSHRFTRTLAERLAADGAVVARVDYPGTGDSDGDAGDLVSLAPWRGIAAVGVAELRRRGARAVVVVGIELGATFALLEAADAGVAGIVTIAPVLSGSRWVRALRLLGIESPDEGVALAGHLFPEPVLAEVMALHVEPPPGIPLLAVPEQPATKAFLFRPAEEATVDDALVDDIASWVEDLVPIGGAGPRTAGLQSVATVHRHSREVREEFVEVGPDGLVGVLSSTGDSDAVYVLVNSGSDPHTGPGRAWVELARDLAVGGQPTLRLDLRGWGESPDGPTTPGRPYDPHGVGDVTRLVDALHEQGQRVVLGGLCAGAWIAMEATRWTSVDGLVVLNPQLYWQPGDPVEALMETTRERRLPEIEAIRRQQPRWDAEDARGLRPPAARLLDDLVGSRVPTSLLFAERDDGLEYLQERLGRRLHDAVESGVVTVTVMPDVDHAMHRTWLRPVVFDAVATELERVLAYR
jgi:alpha-beta hydrolase superfamily lysophospholipase